LPRSPEGQIRHMAWVHFVCLALRSFGDTAGRLSFGGRIKSGIKMANKCSDNVGHAAISRCYALESLASVSSELGVTSWFVPSIIFHLMPNAKISASTAAPTGINYSLSLADSPHSLVSPDYGEERITYKHFGDG